MAAMTLGRVREAMAADMPAIRRIYAHHVVRGLATFEIDPPDEAEMLRRYEAASRQDLPFLVAELEGEVRGFAYARPYRARPAYRHTVEDSVYVAPDALGRGLGRALLSDLVLRCSRPALRQMIAVIGDSGNTASIRLHEALGFSHAGLLRSVGHKFGRWVDSVIMQRSLGEGDASQPP